MIIDLIYLFGERDCFGLEGKGGAGGKGNRPKIFDPTGLELGRQERFPAGVIRFYDGSESSALPPRSDEGGISEDFTQNRGPSLCGRGDFGHPYIIEGTRPKTGPCDHERSPMITKDHV